MDAGAVYTETRERLAALVTAEADRAGVTVPACPDWSVKDVVAHVTGLAEDWLRGNLTAYATDEWTAAQVAARSDKTLGEVLAEWADDGPAVEGMMNDPAAFGVPDFMPLVVITDLVSHEHDVRHALGAPGARDSAAVLAGLRSLIGGLRMHLSGLGLPTLEVEAIGLRSWRAGLDDPAATVRAEPFELFRVLGGRRTAAEVRALDWEGDAEAFIPQLLQRPFSYPETPLGE